MDRSRVAVVVPALNEARTIRNVVAGISAYGDSIVVDDGSSDGTGSIAAIAGAEVISHTKNLGYDQALNSGCMHAARSGYDFVITMDADGQHNPGQLAAFAGALRDGAWLVVGRRDRMQRFSERVFGWVAFALWGIADPLCGMKAYRADAIRNRGAFDTYGSIGTEMALWIARRGLPVKQISVKTRDREGSPRFGGRIRANLMIFRALAMGLARR
jgi:glycosyltransferase involved in cell wall biosynthesis